jgi:hypothetical protein
MGESHGAPAEPLCFEWFDDRQSFAEGYDAITGNAGVRISW